MKLFEKMLLRLYSICFIVEHNFTAVIQYSITFDVGESGSEDSFTLTAHGRRDTMMRSIYKRFKDNHGLYTYKTENENLGEIRYITIKSNGYDGLSLSSITIASDTHLFITNCDCLVDDGATVTKPVTRIVCRETNMDLFCSFVEYTIKIYRSYQPRDLTSNLTITVTGDLGTATFNVPLEGTGNDVKFVKAHVNIGKISSGVLGNVTNGVNAVTVADTRYEYLFEIRDLSYLAPRVDVSKTVCLYGWTHENECDVFRYRLFVEMSKPQATIESLSITVTGKHKDLIFIIDKLSEGQITTINNDSSFLGEISKLEIIKPNNVRSITVRDGRMEYIFNSINNGSSVSVTASYCIGARQKVDTCQTIYYEGLLKVQGDFREKTMFVIILSGSLSRLVFIVSIQRTISPQTISVSRSYRNIKEITKVTLQRYSPFLKRLQLLIYDGRITYLFTYHKGSLLKLTKIYCPPGFHGHLCRDACNISTWGDDCKKKCRCKDGCDSVTGYCKQPCEGGRTGISCHNLCPDGLFGVECRQRCHCVATNSCHVMTGECRVGGCAEPWTGPFCQIAVCPDGHKFGFGCQKKCHCASGTCDPHTGACASGCDHLHYAIDCQSSCPLDTYGNGTNCTGKCHCDVKQACHVGDGKCLVGGCRKGWTDDDCQAKCLHGKPPCMKPCACSGQPCDRLNGSCLCGWRSFGDMCQNRCVEMRFFAKTTDRTCNGVCHCKNDSLCQVWDGTCVGGECKLGWSGPKCQTQVDKGSASMRYVIGYVAAAASGCFLVLAVALFIRHTKRRKSAEKVATNEADAGKMEDVTNLHNITSGMSPEEFTEFCKSLNSLTQLASSSAVTGNKTMTEYLNETLSSTINIIAHGFKQSAMDESIAETEEVVATRSSPGKMSKDAPSKSEIRGSKKVRSRHNTMTSDDDTLVKPVAASKQRKVGSSVKEVTRKKPKANKLATSNVKRRHKSRKSKSTVT